LFGVGGDLPCTIERRERRSDSWADGMVGESMLANEVRVAHGTPTVLLVEDEVLIRLMIAEELRSQRLHVVEASNAEEAMTILDSAIPIDLLFTDIRMPGRIDGVGLVQLARARFPKLKVIMTSSHPSEAAARDLADSFLFKPYDLPSMVEQVEKLLAGCADDAAAR
jgi:DNA-binding NtrC family response regulator